MINKLNYIFIPILFIGITYLVLAFNHLSFSPHDWSEWSRIIFGAFTLLFSMFSLVARLIEMDNIEQQLIKKQMDKVTKKRINEFAQWLNDNYSIEVPNGAVDDFNELN